MKLVPALIFGVLLGSGLVDAQWITVTVPGTPRDADGKPALAAPAPKTADETPDLTGVWMRIRSAPNVPGQSNQNLRYLLPDGEMVPYQPWAEALYLKRIAANSGGAPHERCLPSGIPGNMLPPRPGAAAVRLRTHLDHGAT